VVEATPATPGTRAVVTAYFAAIRAMDADAFTGVFAEDAVVFNPVAPGPIESREELRRFLQALWEPFTALEPVQDHAFYAYDGCAVKWTIRATGRQGGTLHVEGIDVFEVNEDGRIQTLWSYQDPLPYELFA
jgi:steroid Delta-isomerase